MFVVEDGSLEVIIDDEVKTNISAIKSCLFRCHGQHDWLPNSSRWDVRLPRLM